MAGAKCLLCKSYNTTEISGDNYELLERELRKAQGEEVENGMVYLKETLPVEGPKMNLSINSQMGSG